MLFALPRHNHTQGREERHRGPSLIENASRLSNHTIAGTRGEPKGFLAPLSFRNAKETQARPAAHPRISHHTLPAMRLQDSAKRDSAGRYREHGLPEVSERLLAREEDVQPGAMSEIAFHEKAGRRQVNFVVFSLDKVFSPRRVATVAMLPSALSRSESFRSVHVGRSRFSRCCHLIGALWFCSWSVEPGPGD